jgi:hypothetical protein
LIYYLREETTESTTIDAVCTWIDVSENSLQVYSLLNLFYQIFNEF